MSPAVGRRTVATVREALESARSKSVPAWQLERWRQAENDNGRDRASSARVTGREVPMGSYHSFMAIAPRAKDLPRVLSWHMTLPSSAGALGVVVEVTPELDVAVFGVVDSDEFRVISAGRWAHGRINWGDSFVDWSDGPELCPTAVEMVDGAVSDVLGWFRRWVVDPHWLSARAWDALRKESGAR